MLVGAAVRKAAVGGWRERLRLTLALWPYTVPLASVYFAEYAMQSGAWCAALAVCHGLRGFRALQILLMSPNAQSWRLHANANQCMHASQQS